jgi:hypothetical protein
MITLEQKLKNQYADIIRTLELSFPGVSPPESKWILLWQNNYQFPDIMAAITTLYHHPMKARFTQDSVGRAIGALLKDAAMKRAAAAVKAAKP